MKAVWSSRDDRERTFDGFHEEGGMYARRQWLRTIAASGFAAWTTGRLGAIGQEPAKKAANAKNQRRVARKPAANALTPTAPGLGSFAIGEDRELSRRLLDVRDDQKMPGMIGAIVQGNGLAAIGAAGVRKLGSDEPLRINDAVHLGSCTKAMTATLLGMLVENGLITWTSTIAEIFPKAVPRIHPEFHEVTLTQLLNHSAGLPHDDTWWLLPGRSLAEQRRSALVSLMSKPPATRPGTTYAYSNAGYVLAGLMAEEVAGLSWETQIQDRLFRPLGMTSAGFGPTGSARSNRVSAAWGHRENHGRIAPIQLDNAPCMGPAGTVHCTVADWGRFAAVHLLGEQRKTQFLAPETFGFLHSPAKRGDYAGGWIVVNRPWAAGKALTHSGSNTTWYATVWIAPRRNFATLIATNQGGDEAAMACELATQELIGYASLAGGSRPLAS